MSISNQPSSIWSFKEVICNMALFYFPNLFPVFQYLAHKRINGAFNAERISGEWIHLEDVEVSKLNIKSIPFFPDAISLYFIFILVTSQ